jgi:hypothetical protein
MTVALLEKTLHFDPSTSDPPEQDEYEYWMYRFDVDGRIYDVRRYTDFPTEAHFLSTIRNADEQALLDAASIARYLVDHEGVSTVNRHNTATGVFDRRVQPE